MNGYVVTFVCQLNSNLVIINSLNERLLYIEENLSILTSEEYTYSGSQSIDGLNAGDSYVFTINFDRTFLEIPTLTGSATTTTSQASGRLSVTFSNITTTSAKITVKNTLSPGDYRANSVKIQYSAYGLIRKTS